MSSCSCTSSCCCEAISDVAVVSSTQKIKIKIKNGGAIEWVHNLPEMASSPRHVAHHGKGNGLRLGSGSGGSKDAGGNTGPNKNVRDKKLRRQLDKSDARASEATKLKKRNEVLLQEEAGFLEAEGMERTYKFTQQEIVKNVDISSAKKAFNLTLDELGPYCIDYTRNGRYRTPLFFLTCVCEQAPYGHYEGTSSSAARRATSPCLTGSRAG